MSVEEKLDAIIAILTKIGEDIDSFRQFVLEVTPQDAIIVSDELEAELES